MVLLGIIKNMFLSHGIQAKETSDEILINILKSGTILRSKGRTPVEQAHLPVVYMRVHKTLESALEFYRHVRIYEHVLIFESNTLPKTLPVKIIDYDYSIPNPPTITLENALAETPFILGVDSNLLFLNVSYIFTQNGNIPAKFEDQKIPSLSKTNWIVFVPDTIETASAYYTQLEFIQIKFFKGANVLSSPLISFYEEFEQQDLLKMAKDELQKLDTMKRDDVIMIKQLEAEVIQELSKTLNQIKELTKDKEWRETLMFVYYRDDVSYNGKTSITILLNAFRVIQYLYKELSQRFNKCIVCGTEAKFVEEGNISNKFCEQTCQQSHYAS